MNGRSPRRLVQVYPHQHGRAVPEAFVNILVFSGRPAGPIGSVHGQLDDCLYQMGIGHFCEPDFRCLSPQRIDPGIIELQKGHLVDDGVEVGFGPAVEGVGAFADRLDKARMIEVHRLVRVLHAATMPPDEGIGLTQVRRLEKSAGNGRRHQSHRGAIVR